MQVKVRSFTPHSDYFCGKFVAMSTSCEVLIESEHEDLAQEIAEVIIREALRVEHKFSRYRTLLIPVMSSAMVYLISPQAY
ncbi:MAG: hypothetical protein GJ671_04860 [Alteromonadaceae bacterium]|nr:hypothetical protein [Alteromonadaceae bacterium]